MSKVSDGYQNTNSLYWAFDERNHKMLMNFPKLFESHLDVESSRLFAKFKKDKVGKFMERGYYPNTLMSEVSKADDDYQVLKQMFNLQ